MEEGKALIGIRSGGADEEERLVWIPGESRVRDGQVRLSYTERVTEEMDEADATDVILHARDGLAMMKRIGPYATSMCFSPHERREATYRTPYGDLSAVIDTESVCTEITACGGEVDIRYALSIQGGEAADRSIRLTWRWLEP